MITIIYAASVERPTHFSGILTTWSNAYYHVEMPRHYVTSEHVLVFRFADGPYGGGECASTNHSHHLNNGDSVYHQTMLQNNFYGWMRERNMFSNVPDDYNFAGSNKGKLFAVSCRVLRTRPRSIAICDIVFPLSIAAMRNVHADRPHRRSLAVGYGYNEDQYSLPRLQDIQVTRAGIYTQTFRLVPTMGWGFAPLVDYHGGGDAASFEPLSQNIADYDYILALYMSTFSGCLATPFGCVCRCGVVRGSEYEHLVVFPVPFLYTRRLLILLRLLEL
jgi:hypothetical protein